MANRDDMVISPSLDEDRGKPSKRVGEAGGKRRFGNRQGRLFRKAAAARAVQRARARRVAAQGGAGRIIARAAATAAVVAAIAGAIVKRRTGMTFEQMGQKGAEFFFGDKAMEARAAASASSSLLTGNMSMAAFQRETERAERTGTTNRAAADTAIVHAQLKQMELQRQQGLRGFIFDDRFRVNSIADILADETLRIAAAFEHFARVR